jgi:flagellar protein FlbD
MAQESTDGLLDYRPGWFNVILLSRLGGPVFALNPDLIERAEATPDTVVTLVGGNKYVVRESLAELIELITSNRAEVIALAERLHADVPGPDEDQEYLSSRGGGRQHESKRDTLAAMPTVVPLHPRET